MRWLVSLVLLLLALGALRIVGCGDYGQEGCESPWTGACEGVDCNDGNPCTVGECFYNLLTGRAGCLYDPVADGTACEANGVESVCRDGVCEDDDLCTRDVCIPKTGMCEFPPVVCSDDNECTADFCDPTYGVCRFDRLEDGTPCNGGLGTCIAGECEERCEADADCNDRKDCTNDVCNTNGICTNEAVADGTSCSGGICEDGECALDGTVLPCTEQAIRNAISVGSGPYTFTCDGTTPVVTEAEIVIDNDVILDGEGNLTVDGNDDHTVFSVPEDVTAELRGLAVTKGNARGGYYYGAGGINNEGTLTLINITVSGNSADSGGGISNQGTLTLINGTVSGNSARGGGGIHNGGSYPSYGTLTLINSTVSGNSAEYTGGGISKDAGTLTLTNSIVSGNSAGAHGGGISAEGGTLALTNTTVSGNSAEEWGGGIFCQTTLTMTNSTVSGNSAGAQGGGIWSDRCRLTMTNSTVSGNSADSGAGIFDHLGSGTLMLTNSLVDNDCADVTAISGGHNIESPGDTCGFDPDGTDKVDVTEPQLNLGELADNGGRTMTHALLPGSVAIDQIPATECEVDTDQRGVTRPQGDACDVGAFEVQP